MPDAKDNAKMTGDTHPPEVESDLPAEEGSANAAGTTGTPRGRGIKKAGLLKDKDDQTSDSYGNTRDSGEGSEENRG